MKKYRIMQLENGDCFVQERILFSWYSLNKYGSIDSSYPVAIFMRIEDAERLIEKCKNQDKYPQEIKRL